MRRRLNGRFFIAGISCALVTLTSCSAAPLSEGPLSAPASALSSTASPSVSPTPSPSASATANETAIGTAQPFVGEVIPASITGLHVAGVQAGAWPDGNVPIGTLRLWDAGTNWSQIEAVQGVYNWKALDTALKTARAHDIRDVLLVLGGTPTWNASRVRPGDYPVPGAASAPKDLQAWDEFVSAVVGRYAGQISAYQIWNEASLQMFWNGTPEKLAEMTASASDIIRAADPKATVVAASTTARIPAAFNRFFPRYLAALALVDWPIDVYAAHLYPSSRQTTDERAAFIGQVHAAISAAGGPDLPVWDTELNYGLAGPGTDNPHQTVAGVDARDWVVQTAADSLHLGVARTYWYIWTPAPYPLLGMQLTNTSAAVRGLRIVQQWMVGSTWQGCSDDGSVTACALTKNGVPATIAWANTATGAFSPPAGLSQACTTANRCTDVVGPVVLTETPMRFIP